jgi:hypothetical protein
MWLMSSIPRPRKKPIGVIWACLLAQVSTYSHAQLSTLDGSIDEALVDKRARSIVVRGWVTDERTNRRPTDVEILLDTVPSGLAHWGPIRSNLRSDASVSSRVFTWEATIPISELGAGTHDVRARAFSRWGPPKVLTRFPALTVVLDPQDGARTDAPFLNGSADLLRLTNGGRTLQAAGWAGDMERQTIVARVELSMNGRIVGIAELGLLRADVDRVFPGRGLARSGWAASVDLSAFPEGEYSVSATAVGYGCRRLQLKGSQVRVRIPPRAQP